MSKEDQEEKLLEVTITNRVSIEDTSVDSFEKSLDEIRSLRGLHRNFIRKADRAANKEAQSKRVDRDRHFGYNYLDCVTPPYNFDYLSKLYDLSPAHHSASNAKVDNIVGLGWEWIESHLVKEKKSKAKTKRKLEIIDQTLTETKNALNEWIDTVSKEDPFEETLRKIWIDYEATGNGYMEIGRMKNGQIGYIGHIPPNNLRVRVERDGYVQIVGNIATYFRNFGEQNPNPVTTDTMPNEIIHFKKYSPTNAFYGVPDIISAKTALAGNEFAARYNLDYFENKAIPRYAIIAKGSRLSQGAINKLVEFFETGLRGKHHRSVYIPIPAGDNDIKFEAIESSTQDSSFGSYRESNNEEIFMAHRVHKSRAGVLDSSGGLSAARDADKIFKESVCRPEQRIIEKKLNKIFKEITDMFLFKLSELSLTDEDTQSKIDERNVRMGIDVPDEVRARDGKPPRPDGKGNEPWAANPQQAAEQNAQSAASRTRDSERSAGASDSDGEGRNEQGAGRKTS